MREAFTHPIRPVVLCQTADPTAIESTESHSGPLAIRDLLRFQAGIARERFRVNTEAQSRAIRIDRPERSLGSSFTLLRRRRAPLQQRAESNGKKIIDRRTARVELHGPCRSAPTRD